MLIAAEVPRCARLLVRQVQRVGIVGLRAHQARQPVDEPQVLAHLEALVEGVDVAQVAARDDDPVRHLPQSSSHHTVMCRFWESSSGSSSMHEWCHCKGAR